MHQQSIISEFQQDVEYFYKFYEGPRILPKLEYLFGSQTGENDVNVLTFIRNTKDRLELEKTKGFRMKNQMNLSSSPFNVHYWMIEDTALAEQLGMSTSEEDVGDVYVLRKDSVYTDGKKPNLQLDGYPYISEKVLSWKEVMGNVDAL